MKIFGLEISFAGLKKALSPVHSWTGGWHTIHESHPGAWQQDVEVRQDTVFAFPAVFACQTLIASDIAKLRIKLVAQSDDGIWVETKNPAYSPVLRKPNHFQNRMQFFENWLLSKLGRGNTYVLKRRDGRRVVTGLYVLNPDLVTPLVASDGSVFYQLQTDNLAGLPESVLVPASEIIHDRFNCFFHPLIGLSPIYANGIAAMQGNAMQTASTKLFQNGARPGGILTAPGEIGEETAARLKEYWDQNFTGRNAGKVAVLGDGLKYEALAVKATDAQLVEQMKWTAEVVCSTYHVPPYKIGIGQMPTNNNVQSLNIEYYSQALQVLIEAIELCLDEGLGMDGETLGTEFDLEGLLRMDSATQMDVLEKSKGKLTVNEQRKRLGMKPVDGGDTVYLQEQDHSLAWLARRDAMPIEVPAAPPPAPAPPPPEPEPSATNDNDRRDALALGAAVRRALREKRAPHG
ncbi:HK97 family phage portal protein [Sphingomonas sp. BE123]|uniref:phage portal protein n=1 Tax=Sphingomonas sp. BE123 TaxID=2817842 RepID=UPI002857B37E|nr:phage portal protein [Sphingomonas sp. BE123]MDR6851089.1 HK97 family phage portal protein [Sphingomonas sp. BE123]